MQRIFETNISLILLSCIIFTATFGQDKVRDFSVDCGLKDTYAGALISCSISRAQVGKGYILHVIPLFDNKEDGEKMEKVDTDDSAAWCTFPKHEDGMNLFERRKGQRFLLHFQTPDLYLFALTDQSNFILGRDFIQVNKYDSCQDMKVEPQPNTDVSISDEVEVKIDFGLCDVSRRVTWDMRRSYFSFKDERNCFNEALIGKLDMAAFMSMASGRPADVQTVGYLLPIPVYARPIGITFFTATVHIEKKIYIISTFILSPFTLATDNIQHELTIIFEPFPNTNLIWFEERDLILNASKSFSRQLSEASGFVGKQMDVLRFEWKCDGRALFCDNFPREGDIGTVNTVRVPAGAMRDGEVPIEITVTVYFLREDLESPLFTKSDAKTIEVTASKWPLIELRCVSNCYGPFVMKTMPRLLRFHCPNCYEDTYTIKWVGCNPAPCAENAVYYTLSDDLESISLEVTNKDGSQIKFAHKFNILETNAHTTTPPTFNFVTSTDQGVHWFDISKGVEEVDHPMLYRYKGTLLGVDVDFFWMTNFNQHVLNVPYQLKGQGAVESSRPKIHEKYQWLNGDEYGVDDAIFVAAGSIGDGDLSDQWLENLWKATLADLPFTQSVTAAVILYANFLKNEWPNKATPEILENMMNFFIKKVLTYSDALGVLSIFSTELTSKTVKCTTSFLSLYLDVWTAAMDVCLKHPSIEFNDQECMTLGSLSEMYNNCTGILKKKVFDSFFDLLSKMSKHRGQLIHDELTCSNPNWFMLWKTASFYFENNFKYDAPIDFKGYFTSVEFDHSAYKESARLSESIDLEAYIAIYTITKPSYTMIQNAISAESINIEFHGRWNNEPLRLYNTMNAMTFQFGIPIGELRYTTSKINVEVKGKTVTETDCIMMRISVQSSIPELLVLLVPDKFVFQMAYTVADDLKAEVDFLIKDDHKWTDIEGTTLIAISSLSKTYKFNHLGSRHIYIIQGKSSKVNLNGIESLNLKYTLLSAECHYWDKETEVWDSNVCFTVKYSKDTPGETECRCRYAAGLFTTVVIERSNVDVIDVRKVLPVDDCNYFMFVFIIFLWIIYIALLAWAKRQDIINKHLYRTNMTLLHSDPSDRYHYLVCMRMSSIPGSEMGCRVSFILIGSETTTGLMILDTPRYFKRGAECWFIVTTPKFLGSIYGGVMRLEYPGIKYFWRMTEIDVYDIEMDQMYVLPFNKRVSLKNSIWHIHNPIYTNAHVPPGLYVGEWFIKCLRTGHLVLNLLFAVPGAHEMIYDVTRLHFIVLTCVFVALTFLSSWPSHQGPDVKEWKGINYTNVMIYSPIVMIVDIILYCTLVFPYWSKVMKPPPQIIGNRPSLEKMIAYPAGSASTGSSSTTRATSQTNTTSSMSTVKKKMSSIKVRFLSHIASTTHKSVTKSSVGTDVDNGTEPLDRGSNSVESRESASEPPAEEVVLERRRKPLRWKKGRLESTGTENVCSKICYNLLIALVVLYILVMSWYLSQAGYYMRYWKFAEIVGYAICVLLFHFIIQQPLLIFVVALVRAGNSRAMYCHAWARKRAAMSENKLSFWKDLVRFNYKERVKANRLHEYKTKNDAHHIMMIMYFKRDKLAAVVPDEDTGPLKAARRADKRGGSNVLVVIIVFATIAYVHIKSHDCFLETYHAFQSLGLSTFNKVYIKESRDVDQVWQEINRMYSIQKSFHKEIAVGVSGGKLAITGILQIRVKPDDDPCPLSSTFKPLLSGKPCHHELNTENEETRFFSMSWKEPVNPEAIPDNGAAGIAFQYKKQDASEIGSGTLGGYYFLPGEVDVNMFATLRQLQQANWIDENTRSIIVEFSLYNMNNGIGSTLQVIYEFQPIGVLMSSSCHSFPMGFRGTETTILMIALFVIGIVTVMSFIREFQYLNYVGKRVYWSSIHHVFEFVYSCLLIVLTLLYVYRFYRTKIKLHDFANALFGSDSAAFITFQDLSAVVYAVNAATAFMAFAILLKILKMASYIKRLNIMLQMFYNVFSLFVTPLVAVVALAFLFVVKFNSLIFYYSDIYRALTTTAQFVLSPLKIHKDVRKNSMIAGTFMIFLEWATFFILVQAGFVVAINEDYSVKKHENERSNVEKSTVDSTNELAQNLLGFDTPEQPPKEEEMKDDERNVDHLLSNAV